MAGKDGQMTLNPERTPRESNSEIDERDRMMESPPSTPERRLVPAGYHPPWITVATKKLENRGPRSPTKNYGNRSPPRKKTNTSDSEALISIDEEEASVPFVEELFTESQIEDVRMEKKEKSWNEIPIRIEFRLGNKTKAFDAIKNHLNIFKEFQKLIR